MNVNHLSFHDMSSLYDNDVSTENEKNSMLDHIDSCELCRKEYLKLQNMMKLLSRYRNQEHLAQDLSRKIIVKYRFRKKRSSVMRLAPAAAALVFFVFGFGILPQFLNKDSSSIQYTATNNKAAQNEVQKVIGIISNNNAAITNITDLYIEGEIPYRDFNQLRKNLGFRKVTYSAVRGNTTQGLANIENVGASQDPYMRAAQQERDPQNMLIKFRVYK